METPASPDGPTYSPWEVITFVGFVPPNARLTADETAAVRAFLSSVTANLSNGFEERRFDDLGRLEVRYRLQSSEAERIAIRASRVYSGIREALIGLGLDSPPPEFRVLPVSVTLPAGDPSRSSQGRIRSTVAKLFGTHASPRLAVPAGPAPGPQPYEPCEERSAAFAPAFHALQTWVEARWAEGTFLPAVLRLWKQANSAEAARGALHDRLLRAFPPVAQNAVAGRIASAIRDHLERWYLQLASSPETHADLSMEVRGLFDRLQSDLVDQLLDAARNGRPRATGLP